MKKILILLIIMLCFGCAKEEKNITINIYENTDKTEEIEKVQQNPEEVYIEENKARF